MENEILLSINENLVKIINILSAKKTYSRSTKKKQETNTLTYLPNCLSKNNLPVEEDFIKDLTNIINRLDLKEEDVDKVFKRVNEANANNGINDIKKFTYKCLYNCCK